MPKSRSLQEVVDRHLCMGCGICAAARPDLITMVDTTDQGGRPAIKAHASDSELHALTHICPGRSIPVAKPIGQSAADYEYTAWGPILEVWEGFAADCELRNRGSSGGVVSALSSFCLSHLDFAGAIHVRARRDNPLLNESFIATREEEVATAVASRYAPASPCERLADLRHRHGEHVFVGKPCDIAGAAALGKTEPSIADKLGLTISIFCAGTPSLAGTHALARHLGISDQDQILNIKYRGEGWPGAMTVEYREKVSSEVRCVSTSYADGWGNVLQKYKQWRCQLCADHLGDHADLSVGDPWYRPIAQDDPGQSLIVVRTERGRRILRAAMQAGVVRVEPRSIATLAASQPNLEQTKGAVFGRCLTARASGAGAPLYPGAKLHRIWWRALQPRTKMSSILGTLKRLIRKRLWQPERATALAERT